MNYLTTEKFEEHFKFKGETIILSPNIAMIASLIDHDFDYSFDPYNPIISTSKYAMYDTVMIDIIEDHKFPGAKAKHEYNWFTNSINYVKTNGQIIAKVPLKICSNISNIEHMEIEIVHVYEDYAIIKFVKSTSNTNTTVSYGDEDFIQINSKKVPILTQNNKEYYSYFQSVSDEDSFDYISLTAGGKKTCREQFNDRVDWNIDQVVCVSTGADNRKISNRLKFYSFGEIADMNRAVDCYHIPDNISFETFVNILNSKKFLSFLSSVCYDNYQTFRRNFKKKVFNKKILEFCNEK